jgi:PAS domain S-box-containing protein/diguanylate cyclase (GGDEF)-like protein
VPYLVCQSCGFRAYSAAGHASVDECPVCATPLPRRSLGSLAPRGASAAPDSSAADRVGARLRAEIEARLGQVPRFFEPALPDPHVSSELWRQTQLEWLDSQLPATFRYAVLDALAERSPWPWAAVAGALHEVPAHATAPAERAYEGWPDPGTSEYDELLALTLQLIADGPGEDVGTRLAARLGDRRYASLVGMLTYLETCRVFAQAHPGLAAAAQTWRRSGDPHGLAVIEIDRSGSMTSFSPVVEELFGFAAPALLGRPLVDLFAPDGREAVERLIEEFGDSDGAAVREQSFRLLGRRDDGTTFEATLILANRGRDGARGAMTAIVDAPASQPRPERDEPATDTLRAQLAFEGAPIGMALVSLDAGRPGVITEVNRAMPVITGREASALIGTSISDLIEPTDADIDADLLAKLLAGEIPWYEVRKRVRRVDGEPFWGELSVSLIRHDKSHEPIYLVVQLADISERKRVEDALHTSWDRYASVFDEAPLGMGLATLDGHWVQVNDALCQTLGYAEGDLLAKQGCDLIAPDEVETVRRYLRQLVAGEVLGYHVETRAVRADGQMIWVQLSVSLIHDYNGEPAYVFAELHDISERKRLEEELEQGALLDAVTGLPSRALLFDRLEQARARLERSGSPFVVMFASVEGLEPVSARFGRERADAALTELGARMLAAVRSGDTVARYGADEFVILSEDLESEAEAGAIANRILELGRFTVGDDESPLELSLTLGLTVAANSDDAPAALVERADAAMQLAQGQGGGYQEYSAIRSTATRYRP